MTRFVVIETRVIVGSTIHYVDTLAKAQQMVNTLMEDQEVTTVTLCAVLEVTLRDLNGKGGWHIG